ncbi:hypothetical protein GCM10008985_04840 [Halococcus dombrowskii]|uniref:Transposase n=1 Tax=Halococcus dombrowskii TaxID=179637 RepID=A0AAV3SD82_HALDO
MPFQHIGLFLQSIYHGVCYLISDKVNLVIEEDGEGRVTDEIDGYEGHSTAK